MLEKELFPELKINELVIEDDCASAHILDAEIDPFKCTFDYSNTVKIEVGSSYICLTPENLKTLLRLIKESEIYYSSSDGNIK
jgi:hypothetical protein